jgi:hypothetical protein
MFHYFKLEQRAQVLLSRMGQRRTKEELSTFRVLVGIGLAEHVKTYIPL